MEKKPNVTIIVLDTMRLDMFDRLIAENPNLISGFNAIRFGKCIAPGSWTLPSHASLFTGMSQTEHGCHETKSIKSLDIDNIKLTKKTITERLKDKGYATYGLSANPYIHPIYGFEGFDTYVAESYFTDIFGSVIEISEDLKPKVSKYRNVYGGDLFGMARAIIREDPNLFFELILSAGKLTPKAAYKKLRAKLIDGWPVEKGGKNMLKAISGLDIKEPFFLFVNFMEAHDPYIGKKGKDFNWATPFMKDDPKESLISAWKSLYSKAAFRALKYGSELIRHLLEKFGDDQIIILTSDHGQLFGEHGFVGHGTVIPDEIVKVPLLVIVPKHFAKNKGAKGYQSLINIQDFILAAVDGDRNALSKLTKAAAITETFSIPANISNVSGVDKKKMAKLDRYQKRVFK